MLLGYWHQKCNNLKTCAPGTYTILELQDYIDLFSMTSFSVGIPPCAPSFVVDSPAATFAKAMASAIL